MKSDSTLLANKDISVLLQISDERKSLEKQTVVLNDRISILTNRIDQLNTEILKKDGYISIYQAGIEGYKVSEQNLIEQRTNLEKALKKTIRQLRWAKTKLFLFAGVVVAGSAALLIMK